MEVEPLDDALTRHDVYQSVYRVDFWRALEPQPGADPAAVGFERDSYRIRGTKSVRRARSWAEENGGGREFVIWIELGPEDDRTIARVEGVDPTNPSQVSLAE